jgi:beta-galactosidase
MIRTAFDDDWALAPRASIFEQLAGAAGSVPVTLPHDAMLAGGRDPDSSGGSHTGYFRPGAWQYEKSFDAPREWEHKRVTFEFEGVYRDAMVYINGEFAGQWANGYSTFRIPADPFLQYGASNTIRVEAQAHEDSRWYSGAGIHRPVHLLVGDLVHISPEGPRVTTPQIEPDLASAVVATDIVNAGISTATVGAALEIRDPSGAVVATDRARITVRAGERLTVRQRAYIEDPELWGPDSPRLYTATVRLDGETSTDEATTTFGIRSIALDPRRGLRINGEQIALRGACIHHDNGILGSAAFSAAEERRVRRLKAAGFNALRSSHNPLSTAMLEACDRHGMLVMDETFDIWTQSKTADDYSRRFPQWWERDVDALVAKDFNHPSVIFYSIGNEIQEIGTPHGARLGRLLAERVRAQDPTRLITGAINGFMTVLDKLPELTASSDEEGGFNDLLSIDGVMEAAMTLPEVGERITESASVLDVVGLNYGDSRYSLDAAEHPNRIMVGSETFPTQIARLWHLVTENDQVIGDFTWTGWDYLGEAGLGRPKYPGDGDFAAAYPQLVAGCGDIDITGRRRPISYYREIVFGLRRDPYLAIQRPEHRGAPAEVAAWSWSDARADWTWDVPAGSPVTAEAYADADEVAFVLNGTEVARRSVGTERSFVATAEVPYETGVLEAVAYRDGEETGRCRLTTASAPARIALAADAVEGDIVLVDIDLEDADGTRQPASDRPVTIELEGPAELRALGSARPDGDGDFLEDSCTTYEGHALAAVRPTGPGSITVTARAEGLEAATLAFESAAPAERTTQRHG